MKATFGRPKSAEAAAYYFTYINRVAGEDVVRILSDQLEEALPFLTTISERDSLIRYADDKWSIRQVLNHVSDSERLFGFRALWFARNLGASLPSFDQNIAVTTAQADHISWAAHIEEFRRMRLSSLSLFENMPEDAWLRGGIASDNYVSARALAYIMAGHLNHHLALLRERYLKEEQRT